MPSQGKFSYENAELSDLEIALSPERFAAYLTIAQQDRLTAMSLYERNTALSEALYGVIQGLEVPLRNHMHNSLIQSIGPQWFLSNVLQHPQTAMVADVIFDLNKQSRAVTGGRVVSELSFGFWTSLLGPRYEKTLWVPHLHAVFPNATYEVISPVGRVVHKLARHRISLQLNEVRKLRNRIAHHECIVNSNLQRHYEEIMQCIEWICPTTASWVQGTNCFLERFQKKA